MTQGGRQRPNLSQPKQAVDDDRGDGSDMDLSRSLATLPACYDLQMLEAFLSETDSPLEGLTPRAASALLLLDGFTATPDDVKELTSALADLGLSLEETPAGAPRKDAGLSSQRLTPDEEVDLSERIASSYQQIIQQSLMVPLLAQYVFSIINDTIAGGSRKLMATFDVARFTGSGDDADPDDGGLPEDEDFEAANPPPDADTADEANDDSEQDADTDQDGDDKFKNAPQSALARRVVMEILAHRDNFLTGPIKKEDAIIVTRQLHDGLRFRFLIVDRICANFSSVNDRMGAIRQKIGQIARRHKLPPSDVFDAVIIGGRNLPKLDASSAELVSLRELALAFANDCGLPLRDYTDIASTLSRAIRVHRASRDEMMVKNSRLVTKIATDRIRSGTAGGLDFDDLVQEGNIGLMRGIEKFDHTKGTKLSTYAGWWIRQAMNRAISDQSRVVRISVHMRELAVRVSRLSRLYSQQHGVEPTIRELSDVSRIPVEQIRLIKNTTGSVVSLDAPVFTENDPKSASPTKWIDALVDGLAPSPEQILHNKELRRLIVRAVDGLPPRSEEVLFYRMGLVPTVVDTTLSAIGDRYHITRERLRQLEQASLGALANVARLASAASSMDDPA